VIAFPGSSVCGNARSGRNEDRGPTNWRRSDGKPPEPSMVAV